MNDSFNPNSETLNWANRPTQDIDLAGRWARLIAALIDATIGGTLTFLLTNALGYYDNLGTNPTFFDRFTGLLIGMATVVAVQGYFLYRYGQTIGKMWLGIRIATLNGAVPGLARLLCLRLLPVSCLTLVPGAGSLLPLVDGLFIFRRDRRCLHDLLACTRVVKTERGPKTLLISAFALTTVTSAVYMLLPLFVFFSLDRSQQLEVMQNGESMEQHLPSWALQKSLPPGFGPSPKQTYINKLDKRCVEGRQIVLAMVLEREKLEDEASTLLEETKKLVNERKMEKAADKYEEGAEKMLLANKMLTKTVASIDQLYRDLRGVAAPRPDVDSLKQIWDLQSQTIAKLLDIAVYNEKNWGFLDGVSGRARTDEERLQLESLIEQRFAELEAITQNQIALAQQYGFHSCFVDYLFQTGL